MTWLYLILQILTDANFPWTLIWRVLAWALRRIPARRSPRRRRRATAPATDQPRTFRRAMSASRRLNYTEATAYLGLMVATLRSMVCRKQVPHFRLSGKMVRFDLDELGQLAKGALWIDPTIVAGLVAFRTAYGAAEYTASLSRERYLYEVDASFTGTHAEDPRCHHGTHGTSSHRHGETRMRKTLHYYVGISEAAVRSPTLARPEGS